MKWKCRSVTNGEERDEEKREGKEGPLIRKEEGKSEREVYIEL